jgi:hypothetical protein
MKTWYISPLILALGFAGLQGYKWYTALPEKPGVSSKATALGESMVSDPAWRLGKRNTPCLINEKMKLRVDEDGTVRVWEIDGSKEAFLGIYSSKIDRDWLSQKYHMARITIEERLVTRIFEKPVSATVAEEKPLATIEVTIVPAPELTAMPAEIEVLPLPQFDLTQEELDNLADNISKIKEPRKKDKAEMLYKQLLEALDLSPGKR